jgi:hypothetical protein
MLKLLSRTIIAMARVVRSFEIVEVLLGALEKECIACSQAFGLY